MKTERQTLKRITHTTLVGTAAALLSLSANAAETFEGGARDAWVTGKIETVFLLNEHLNPFTIDTDVENGIVKLTGTVESDIDRDLAETLAEGVDGVIEVDNDLMIDAEIMAKANDEPEAERSFGTWVDDATTTAAVKSKLVANQNVKGLEIDVDTRGDVVTLSGRVDSDEQKMLAAELARNTGDVRDVRNNLVVDPE